MAGRCHSLLNGITYAPTPPRANQDVFIDMQYAKHTCIDKMAFVEKPWEHCQDPTNTYLGLRVSQRELFKSKLDQKQLKRIQHEDGRIQQTRVNFSSYERKKALMKELKEARHAWTSEVKVKREEYIRKIMENKPKYPASWNRNQELDIELLERVKAWPVNEIPVASELRPHLEPDLWLGVTHDHPKYLPGTFPNQKLPVHNLIRDRDNNPLSEPCPPDQLRYFHLPTNNMRWIEQAMARYYNEPDGDHNDLKHPDKMTKAEKLLCREFWRGQLHGGDTGNAPIHARHMRSRCSIIPSDVGSGAYTQRDAISQHTSAEDPAQKALPPRQNPKNLAMFLPYLHWETDSRRAKMSEVIKEITGEHKKQSSIKSRTKSDISFEHGLFNALRNGTSKSKRLQQQMKRFEKPKKTKLGRYLMALALVADAIDYEADERLLRKNLHRDPPLHVRRTLDQSYFLTLDDTATRDRDQVVYRETKEGHSFYQMNTRVVMVDQLWLWILDNNTIITSFPRRWGRNKPDPSGCHKSLRDRLAHMPAGQIQSIYDLALIIIDQCSRAFFDRTKPLDQRPEVMDLFASAIGNVTELTTIAYESFWRNMQLRALNPPPYVTHNAHHKYLEINPEGTLLREAQDIAEELQIMLRIYNQQLYVVKDLRKALGHMNGESKNEPDDVRSLAKLMEFWQNHNALHPGQMTLPQNGVIAESTIQEANDLLELIKNRKSEIQDLEDAALRTTQHLQGLLTLKQQQASIIEAKAALRRAEESVRQGRAIMAFTLVTIFFLPLGFFAAFFGMNNREINDSNWMSLAEQIKYMFGLSAAVITIAVSMAFSPWTRAILTVLIQVPLAYLAEYTGLRHFWRQHIVDHQTLERKGQQQLDHIFERQRRIAASLKEEEDRRKMEEAKCGGPVQLTTTGLVRSFLDGTPNAKPTVFTVSDTYEA